MPLPDVPKRKLSNQHSKCDYSADREKNNKRVENVDSVLRIFKQCACKVAHDSVVTIAWVSGTQTIVYPDS